MTTEKLKSLLIEAHYEFISNPTSTKNRTRIRILSSAYNMILRHMNGTWRVIGGI